MQTHCHERVFTHSVISFIQIHADFYVLLYTFPMKFLFINVSILTIHFIVVSSHRILNGDLNWYSRLVSTCQLFFFTLFLVLQIFFFSFLSFRFDRISFSYWIYEMVILHRRVTGHGSHWFCIDIPATILAPFLFCFLRISVYFF